MGRGSGFQSRFLGGWILWLRVEVPENILPPWGPEAGVSRHSSTPGCYACESWFVHHTGEALYLDALRREANLASRLQHGPTCNERAHSVHMAAQLGLVVGPT